MVMVMVNRCWARRRTIEGENTCASTAQRGPGGGGGHLRFDGPARIRRIYYSLTYWC